MPTLARTGDTVSPSSFLRGDRGFLSRSLLPSVVKSLDD